MQVEVGYSDNPDSKIAGVCAAQMALAKAKRQENADLILLFCTASHNQEVLREAVVSVLGNRGNIFGGGSAGVITNEYFGYAGNQVGVACIWLDGTDCNILIESELEKSEMEAGKRLGKKLLECGVTQQSPILLFYDAIDRSAGNMHLMLATWILEGIEKEMGFLPEVMGAGLQGDHASSATRQYTGNGIDGHSVISISFSSNICIDNIVMHGCRPASPYYEVTKAEGSVILEINGTPAIQFMDEVLESSVKPEEYPFFLILGINHGEPWGEYNENNYASRLCLGIDEERGGIVMFEPDMVAGTKFQIMFRSLDLEYMKPKIKKVFSKLNGRKPLFALYIDCAGRCAGYGGIDMEDAIVIQQAVGDEIPLLGIYTGAEIAPMEGKSRGLDLTGVFCLFSEREENVQERETVEPLIGIGRTSDVYKTDKVTLEAVLRLSKKNAAKILALDNASIEMRHELEQKRRGFSLLAELSVSLRESTIGEKTFYYVAQRINAALNMQKTAVLFPDEEGEFVLRIMQGYSQNEKQQLEGQIIKLQPQVFDSKHAVLVTAMDDKEYLYELREQVKISYFISFPIFVKNKVTAILITGRLVESAPFLCRLGRSDVETVQAICGLLSSVVVSQQLDVAKKQAQTDALTGLLNRGALEKQVEYRLKCGLTKQVMFAFLIIDCDFFKEINDSYGHMTGDMVLNNLAEFLQKNFRKKDYVARIGGDEFVVFCEFEDTKEQIILRADYLVKEWGNSLLAVQDEKTFCATVSVGISFAPHDGKTYDELFHCADMALYRSKQQGRNQYTIYDENTMKGIMP